MYRRTLPLAVPYRVGQISDWNGCTTRPVLRQSVKPRVNANPSMRKGAVEINVSIVLDTVEAQMQKVLKAPGNMDEVAKLEEV